MQAYIDRLEKMCEYVLYLTRADGTTALIGDNDNGRLHRLGQPLHKDQEWQDFRYLTAAASCLFDRVDFAKAAGDEWQDAVWFWGETAGVWRSKAVEISQSPTLHSQLFMAGGMAVLRHTDLMMNVSISSVGLNGLGAHAHNDVLGLELFGEGHTWLKDPGTVAYTGDYRIRNRFRSTAVHSTAMVGQVEINRFDEKSPFSMKEDADAVVEKWISNDDFDVLIASHTGYQRLKQPLTHRRIVYFHKVKRFWIVRDVFNGEGEHDIDIVFHFGNVEVGSGNAAHVSLAAQGKTGPHLHILPIPAAAMDLEMTSAESANGYGAWQATPLARYYAHVNLPFESKFFLIILPAGKDMDVPSLKDAAVQAWQRFGLFGFDPS